MNALRFQKRVLMVSDEVISYFAIKMVMRMMVEWKANLKWNQLAV